MSHRESFDADAAPGTFQRSGDLSNREHVASDAQVARGYFEVPTGHAGYDVVYAVAWVASAAASGVVGNVAYAAIQRLLRSRSELLPHSHLYPAGQSMRTEDVGLLAKLAVQAHCSESGAPVPSLSKLIVTETVEDPTSRAILHVFVEGPGLRAEVVLAPGEQLNQSFPVVIWLP